MEKKLEWETVLHLAEKANTLKQIDITIVYLANYRNQYLYEKKHLEQLVGHSLSNTQWDNKINEDIKKIFRVLFAKRRKLNNKIKIKYNNDSKIFYYNKKL